MAAVGQHAVTVTPAAGGAAVAISALVEQVSIHHGRDDDLGQPEADSATLDLFCLAPAVFPPALDIGAVLRVTTTTPNGTWDRFAGRVTDLHLGWQEAGEETPAHGAGQLVAVGFLADTGRSVVGDAPFPQELDGARVARIMQLAGVTLNPATSDPGTVQILARDIDSQPALNVAHDAADSAQGLVWVTRAGEIRYSDATHRRGIQPSLSLDAADILVTPTWRRSTDGLINSVSIGYGATPADGEQPRYVASDANSIAKWKSYGASITTALAALADAQALGNVLLVRNSQPIWLMDALPVAIAELSQAEYEQLLGLDMHSLLTLTGLPAISSAPTSASLWVEGWRETLAYGIHELELAVSGYCRTAPIPRWDDVDPSWLWGGQTVTERRRNLVPNPNFERDVSGWATYTGTAAPVQSSANPFSGTQRLRADGNGASGAPRLTFPAVSGLVAGEVYTLSARLRRDGTWPGGGTAYAGLRFQLAPSSEQVVAAQPVFAPDATGYMRVSVTGTVPAATNGTVVVNLGFAGLASALTAAGSIGLDEVQLVKEASAGAYFDGDTPDTPAVDYAWTGTPGASPSTVSDVVRIPGGVDPALTWDATACLGPPANLGRWNDQPASLRWDQITSSTTWDNYGG